MGMDAVQGKRGQCREVGEQGKGLAMGQGRALEHREQEAWAQATEGP